jgi:hypothetical protein
MFRRKARPRFQVIPRRQTAGDLIALTLNSLGLCAYDKAPCEAEPTMWVQWQDGREHGEAGYCHFHTVALVTARTITFVSRNFPDVKP